MKKLFISSCLITIMTLAPLSLTYASEDTTGSSAAPAVDKSMTQDTEKIKDSKESMNHDDMKMNHDDMKGKSKDDMKDMPM